MKNMGLNLGQRKKLHKYIEFVKKNSEEKPKIMLNKNSNEKEVASFLKEQFNFSDKVIENLGLDGESLYLFTEEDINEIKDLTQEQKDNFNKYLITLKNENNNNEENNIIGDTINSPEISDFKEKINIKKIKT